VSLRTRNDFEDTDKYSPKNTTEAILERERKSNPYKTNRDMRRTTRGIFAANQEVRRMEGQNDGVMQ